MRPFWQSYDDESLLDLKLSELNLTLDGTWVEQMIDRVLAELDTRGLRFKPRFWLADEWCSPFGNPGVGVPFYLTHPRLTRLEKKMMFEVEGGTKGECLKLLRHEVGHAIDHGYRLSRMRRFRDVFGPSQPYPTEYKPNPKSKKFVQHLPGWYAQSHPAEDFAETFAVWLTPRSQWETRYENWPAIRKLRFVDELMDEIAEKPQRVRTRQKPWSLPKLRYTLRTHYERRRERFRPGFSDVYDNDLKKIFSSRPSARHNETAAAFLRRHRAEIREQVAEFTGEYQVTIDQVLKEIIGRCKELKLWRAYGEHQTRSDFAVMATAHTVLLQHRRDQWHPM